MTLPELDAKLVDLRLRATELNTQIAAKPKSQTAGLKQDYAALALEIAYTKNARGRLALQTKADTASIAACVSPKYKVANLLFPATKRVQYFVTDLTPIELLTMLSDVYEDDKPSLVSLFNITEEEMKDIPKSWLELEPGDSV